MRKDIPDLTATECGIALVPADDHEKTGIWEVYFINLRSAPVEHVLVNAKGDGIVKGSAKSTATIRYYVESMPARSCQMLEAMLPELRSLTNEYWVSFRQNNQLFDKKFIVQANLVDDGPRFFIPLLGKVGRWVGA
jgi:hypothetical protein